MTIALSRKVLTVTSMSIIVSMMMTLTLIYPGIDSAITEELQMEDFLITMTIQNTLHMNVLRLKM